MSISNQCNSCVYSTLTPFNYLCVEGLSPPSQGNCLSYQKKGIKRVLTQFHLKDILSNPFEYWDRVPRHVRGVLSHKHLVMTLKGLAIFSHSSWFSSKGCRETTQRRIDPKLITHLKNSLARNKEGSIYINLFIGSQYNYLYEMNGNGTCSYSSIKYAASSRLYVVVTSYDPIITKLRNVEGNDNWVTVYISGKGYMYLPGLTTLIPVKVGVHNWKELTS